jgi:hypothetical protein
VVSHCGGVRDGNHMIFHNLLNVLGMYLAWITPTIFLFGSASQCCRKCTVVNNVNTGPLNVFGWQFFVANTFSFGGVPRAPQCLPIAVFFRYRDSVDCPLTNTDPGRQSGRIECWFTLEEETNVHVSVRGRVERFDGGKDTAEMFINNISRARIESTNENGFCEMLERSSTDQILLPAGTHAYVFNVDTIDQFQHNTMEHLFEISALP